MLRPAGAGDDVAWQWWLGAGDSVQQDVCTRRPLKSISGEIIDVDRITPNKGMAGGVRMNVKTEKETVSVHLGPAWYIRERRM